MTEQGGLQDRTTGSLYVEAVNGALEDAGLTAREIDGIIGAGPEGAGIVGDFTDAFGAPLRFHAQTGVGASSSSAGMGIAAMAIAHGYADVIIVPTASGGAVHPNAPRRRRRTVRESPSSTSGAPPGLRTTPWPPAVTCTITAPPASNWPRLRWLTGSTPP